MKRFTQYLPGLFLGVNLAFSAVTAQAHDSPRVNVTIPFDFVVGGKQLKAGDYVIESLHDNETLRFRREGGDGQQIVFTVPIEANPTGNHERLLFHHDGDKYFLSQVWFWGDEDGRELIPGIQEKSVGKSRPVSGQTVVGQ